LDDYLLRSATLKASLVTVRKAIKSLPKLDTAESIKARAKLESELQTVTEDTAQLTSTIESRTGKIIEQEVVHDSLKPRIVDLEAQIEAIKKLNSGNINNDLKNVIDSNESLRAQLSR
jgi:predicted  nucleic acid-binding Zn-ribbon protein